MKRMRKENIMEKYKVQMVNKYTEEVVEDLVDDQVFDSEEDAQ